MLDNLGLIRENVLDFQKQDDFYVFHILQRAKDKREKHTFKPGDHEDGARLIKTWYIDSLEYFDRKVDTMRQIADANDARIYMLPQVRSKLTCNRALATEIIRQIDDWQIRYDHLLRTAICACHSSRAKRWIIDLDDDLIPDIPFYSQFLENGENAREATLQNLADAVKTDLLAWAEKVLKGEDLADFEKTLLQYHTRNGMGILTKPFDMRIWSLHPDLIKKDGMMLAYCGF